MSHLDSFNLTASNSFGINLEGTFRTAAFGGDALDVTAAPTVDNSFDIPTNG